MEFNTRDSKDVFKNKDECIYHKENKVMNFNDGQRKQVAFKVFLKMYTDLLSEPLQKPSPKSRTFFFFKLSELIFLKKSSINAFYTQQKTNCSFKRSYAFKTSQASLSSTAHINITGF